MVKESRAYTKDFGDPVNWLWLVGSSSTEQHKVVGWVENTAQNRKQENQQPSDRFKLLSNFIYPFYTHARKTHFKYSDTHLTWI